MAYVAVKGGERAIDAAHAWLAHDRRGDPAVPLLAPEQIEQQLGRAVDRVMAEGSLLDRGLAALAIRQAQGDLIEAAFLLRAYRTTLPRFAHSEPVDTGAMLVTRRVSATFKDLPGGQVLGPTYDYTHRLLDPAEMLAPAPPEEADADPAPVPPAFSILGQEGLVEPDDAAGEQPFDLTRAPLSFPAGRDARLQALARGTRDSCWRSAIRLSAAMATRTLSWGSCAWARLRCASPRRSLASPWTSATPC